MAPRPRPVPRLVGSPLGLICVSLLLVPAAAGTACACGLGLSREALIALVGVLAAVGASCLCALLVVALGVVRAKGETCPEHTDSRLPGHLRVQEDHAELQAVHMESHLRGPDLAVPMLLPLEDQGLTGVPVGEMGPPPAVEEPLCAFPAE